MFNLFWQVIAASIFLVAGILVPASSVLAHGDEGHDKEAAMSVHMQAMYTLKGKIPEGYRIMERTPIVPDAGSLNRGLELFSQQCAICHGEQGRGDGQLAKRLTPGPANFLDLEHSAIYGPGEKFWIVGNGSGETGMPAFAQINLLDRWHLVNVIYHLQSSEKSEDNHKSHDH